MLREIAVALKARPARTLALAGGFAVVGAVGSALIDWNSTSARPSIPCNGEYADNLQIQSARVQAIEQGPQAQYTYLVRNTARYECPYFSADGKLRRRPETAVEHGTAFAYETINGETYLLTNEHVAAWPEVTDKRNKVDGVGEGCKRVDEKLSIVQDEHDDFERGHIPLQRVAAEPRLDAAILKTSRPLKVLPYRIGRSASLRQGNAVQVRGFPLGLLHAVNLGKVVNPYDRDLEQNWDHTDFVIDALLSEGNSGSPVLALSCRTGELELVGMYHAGYKEAPALNVVVGIDQLRDFMVKKKRVPRAPADAQSLGPAERRRLEERLNAGAMPLFEVGGLPVLVEAQPEGLRYHFYGRGFPLDDRRLAMLEDLPAPNAFGTLGRLNVRGDAGWRDIPVSSLGEEERDLLVRLSDAVRVHVLRALEYRRLLVGTGSAEDRRRVRELQRALERQALPQRELIASFTDLVERLVPAREGAPVANAPINDGGPPAPTLRP